MNIEQQRAAFEAWARRDIPRLSLRLVDSFMGYTEKETQTAFLAFQAAIAIGRKSRGEHRKPDGYADRLGQVLWMDENINIPNWTDYYTTPVWRSVQPPPTNPSVKESLTVAEPVKEVSDDAVAMEAWAAAEEFAVSFVCADQLGVANAFYRGARWMMFRQSAASAEPVARATVYLHNDRRNISICELGTESACDLAFGEHDLFTAPIAAQPDPALAEDEISDDAIKTLSYTFNKVEGHPSHFHAVFDCVGFARALLARKRVQPASGKDNGAAIKAGLLALAHRIGPGCGRAVEIAMQKEKPCE